MNRVHKRVPAPPLAVLAHLSAMGDGLATACAELALELSTDHCDRLIHKLKGASQAVSQFRRALIEAGQGDEPG